MIGSGVGKRARQWMVYGLSGIVVIFLTGGTVLAELTQFDVDEEKYPPVEIGHPVSRVLQKYTGVTLLSGWISSRVIERAVSEKLEGNLKVSLTPFSLTDLLAGKARKLRVRGKNLLYDGFLPIHRIQLETDEQHPIYLRKGQKPALIRPIGVQMELQVTESDMNRFFRSERGKGYLTRIKVPLPPFQTPQYLDCLEPEVRLFGDRLHVKSNVNVHGAPLENAIPVEVSARILPDGSVLRLSDVSVNIVGISKTGPIETFLEEYFDVLFEDLVKIKIDRHKLKLVFHQAELAEQTLHLNATALIRPDDKTLEALLDQIK